MCDWEFRIKFLVTGLPHFSMRVVSLRRGFGVKVPLTHSLTPWNVSSDLHFSLMINFWAGTETRLLWLDLHQFQLLLSFWVKGGGKILTNTQKTPSNMKNILQLKTSLKTTPTRQTRRLALKTSSLDPWWNSWVLKSPLPPVQRFDPPSDVISANFFVSNGTCSKMS